jgi:hypothetical protein
VLPDEAASVRPSVGVVLCESAEGACGQLEEALRLRPSVLVLDDVDLLAEKERERLFGMLATAMREARERSSALSLVMSGAAEFPVPGFVDPTLVRTVDLDAASPADGHVSISNPGRDA